MVAGNSDPQTPHEATCITVRPAGHMSHARPARATAVAPRKTMLTSGWLPSSGWPSRHGIVLWPMIGTQAAENRRRRRRSHETHCDGPGRLKNKERKGRPARPRSRRSKRDEPKDIAICFLLFGTFFFLWFVEKHTAIFFSARRVPKKQRHS